MEGSLSSVRDATNTKYSSGYFEDEALEAVVVVSAAACTKLFCDRDGDNVTGPSERGRLFVFEEGFVDDAEEFCTTIEQLEP